MSKAVDEAVTPKEPLAPLQSLKRLSPLGTTLTREQRAELDKIADEMGVSGHRLRQFVFAYFLDKYKAGEIEIERGRTVAGFRDAGGGNA